jgi:hypothetical protein
VVQSYESWGGCGGITSGFEAGYQILNLEHTTFHNVSG